jgi:CheY-like chemotaxis protein
MDEGGVLRILVAEDDDSFVELLHELVGGRGEIVGVAATGAEAIAAAGRLHPDVVLMDLDMPVLEGDEATRQIVRADPHTKVVMVSGADVGAHSLDIWTSGAVAYIPKPDVAEQLPKVLELLRAA